MAFEAEIADMSRSGMAVMIYESSIDLPPGTLLKGCRFVVPGAEEIAADVEVCNTQFIVQPGVGPAQRAGLRFLDGSMNRFSLRGLIAMRNRRRQDRIRQSRITDPEDQDGA
jgi:hypothetical protein